MHKKSLSILSLFLPLAAAAQDQDAGLSVFGTLELDGIYAFDRTDPDWNDMFRTQKIITRGNPYGTGGEMAFTPRFSMFGLQYNHETDWGVLKLYGKFDLTGLGDYAGETRPRISRLYVQWGHLLAGKNESLFRDGSAYPDTLEWYGPVGLAGSFPYQLNYTQKTESGHWSLGLEDVTEAIDPVLISRIGGQQLYDPATQQDAPDLVGHYRRSGVWGHLQIGGVLRKITARGESSPGTEFKASDTGWGLNVTGSRKLNDANTLRGGIVGGHGIAGYMNDGGADMVIANNRDPDTAIGQNTLGWSAYLEHQWSRTLSSALGASQFFVENESFEPGTSYRAGTYASANLLYRPNASNLLGVEFNWGQRQDKDGIIGTARQVQISYRFSFNSRLP